MDDFHEQLISDVLGEDSNVGLREALLGQTLRLARRKRRLRKFWQAAPAVAAVAVSLLISVRLFRPGSSVPPGPDRPYTLVRTQPLPTSALVTTKPLAAADLVQTTHLVVVISTVPGESSPRELSDEELLKLADNFPVVLVRQSGHAAELVFVNPKDREAVMRN
jgi:hypothetical protein